MITLSAGLQVPSVARSSMLARFAPEALTMTLGIVVRLVPVMGASFPLGDGGMFLGVVEQLQTNAYRLPEFLSYNGLDIPFSYPPLGFYSAAAFTDLLGVPAIVSLRWLPFLFSVLTVIAFWALARTTLPERTSTLGALFAFGTLPLAYRYFVMGAGITRAPGFLFAILTVWLTYQLCVTDRPRFAILAGVAAAATLMSHPNGAWFATYSAALVVAFHARSRTALLGAATVVVIAGALTAPWFVTVALRHGIAPFLLAANSSNPDVPAWALLLVLRVTEEPIAPILLLLAIAGAAASILERKWWLPTWAVAACILDTRYTGTFAMVPIALLVGVAIGRLVRAAESPRLDLVRRGALLGIVCWIALLTVAGTTLLPGPTLQPLPAGQREAMAWVADHIVEDVVFLVVAPSGSSAGNESEWFPVLARRVSAGTYQGREWMPRQNGPSSWERYLELQRCGRDGSVTCMEEWGNGTPFDYVYVRHEGTEQLRRSLSTIPRYSMVYSSADVSIFRAQRGQ